MSLAHLTITLYSHHFSCTKLSPRGRIICNGFAQKYVQYGFIQNRGQSHRAPLKVYAASTSDRGEYRFHINSLKDFKEYLVYMHCTGLLVDFESTIDFPVDTVDFKVKPNWVARDYQIPVIEYLVKPEPISKLVTLQTGEGKTASALLAIAQLKKRLVIIIKPMYIDKWISDVVKTYDINKDDILVVQGGNQLMALLVLAKECKITEKVIIISNKTFQIWLKAYEKFKFESLDVGYSCYPYELFKELKAGIRLIDEVHQDQHLSFKLDLYTNVGCSISLSATMISTDPFIDRMHKLAYPLQTRYASPPLKKYFDAFAIKYRFNKPDKIRTSEYGSMSYSHNAFEDSVLKHISTLNNYLNLINYTIQISYLKVNKQNKRLLIFAYTVELITLIVEYLNREYPTLNIQRYVSEDDYQNLMTADICVSTLGSSGTAVDIPNLTTVIMTTAVSSIQANIQAFGRLRELKDSPVEFYYFVCTDIPKHIEYDNNKRNLFYQRAKSFREIYSGIVV